ncbi:MAG: uroporphyrinogen decarboxylase [Thermoguttaceae bacterium]|nr:uroporphyrinogen decarboxylase [Thermoguttaceae bacterium]
MSQPLFLRALRREPVSRPPIWMMRQAGRYMAEYREVRHAVSFLELCKRPDLAAEVMLTAVRRLGVDAAILFADLLPILEPMGLNLTFTAGEGPVLSNPIRTATDLNRLTALDATTVHQLDFVFEAVQLTQAGLRAEYGPSGSDSAKPLIGFAGAPFTLASYAIEGGGSRNYIHTKRLMYSEPHAWYELLDRIARSVVHYLNAQIDAGADAVQIFDSWVGCLNPSDYRDYVAPHVRTVLNGLRSGTPIIYFAAGNPALLPAVRSVCRSRIARSDSTPFTTPLCVGVDWRIELTEASALVGPELAIQGNLDPTILLTTPEIIRRETQRLLDRMATRPGWIFNLGHGILPETPVENVLACIETVRVYHAS